MKSQAPSANPAASSPLLGVFRREGPYFLSLRILLALGVLAGCVTASAASTISTADKYAHAANAGWIDFRPDGTHGVRVDESFLSGHAYSANFGWIHLGDGSPENGHAYSNASPSDYGVNLALDGALSGYAYSANIGWIAFEPLRGQPRMNYSNGRFSGKAYAANAGWISLETPSSNLAAASIAPPADADGDGISDAWEMQVFGNLHTANATTDSDGDGFSDLQEYLAGTDPLDATSSLRIVSHSYLPEDHMATIGFTAAPNRLYSIQRGDLQGAWTDAGFGPFAPDGGPVTYRTLVHPAATKLFFRVQAWKPLQN
jgi:hypothetical protein